MYEFNKSEIRRLDGTLLLIFLGLLRDRKATLVAEQLSVTPSTISHALGRLRKIFGDELFLRRSHGLEPTALALLLEAPIRQAVETLNHALSNLDEFDPTKSNAVIRLAAYDLELSTLLPALSSRLEQKAPGIRLIAKAQTKQAALNGLATGDIDIAIGFFKDPGSNYIAQDLLEQRFTVVCRKKDLVGKSMTMKRYLGMRHVLVSPGGELNGIVDDVLAEMNLKREVVLSVPLFLPALAAVANAGLIATVPKLVADHFAASFGLIVLKPPLTIPGFTVRSVSHKRNSANAIINWIQEELAYVANNKY